MSQWKSCTGNVYTRRRAPGKPGRARSRRALPAALLAAALAAAPAPARAEELIRVLVSPEPKEIVELRLEDYVAGVVQGEMPASFPEEARKAQAVAARSYALTRKIEAQAANRDYDIASGVIAQVFSRTPSPAARAAAEATAGEVLAIDMEPVEAYFHASCGGHTEEGQAALGRPLPYLTSVPCGRCNGAPRVRWALKLDGKELARAAGLKGTADQARVLARTPSGRAATVEVRAGRERATVGASDLRQRVGFSRLPSTDFDLRPTTGGFAVEGRGQGHGAGLCQWGAAGLAREGKGYREILLHYYPGTEIVRMY